MNNNWECKKLKDCFKLRSGDGLTSKEMINGDYPVYGGNSQAGTHNEYNLSGDNVIIGRVGALCGNAKHIKEEIWLTDNAFKVTDKKYHFDNSFLTYLLNHNNLRTLARQAAQPVISNSSLAELELRFPLDITEQKRIVAILDHVFSDIEQARAKTEQNLKNARELFESYLQKVFSESGEGWNTITLGQASNGVFTGPFGSLLHKSDYVDDGIPLVNPAHITSSGIEIDTRKTVSPETASRLSNYIMREGDIVIGRRGEMGRCALISNKEDGFLCGTGSFFIKASNHFYAGYLVRYLRSSGCKALLEKMAGGAVMPNLNNTDLSNLSLHLPPLSKQKEITVAIDNVSTQLESVAAIYQKKMEQLEELKKSILQKAFTGQLTNKKGKGVAA